MIIIQNKKVNPMRRSATITLTILTGIALAACDEPQEEIKHCVDENGVVQDEAVCADAGAEGPTGPIDPQHPHVGSTHFFWYYGGGYRAPLTPGTRVTGGSYTPSPGRVYSPPSTITRGGFGSTGHGFGGESGG